MILNEQRIQQMLQAGDFCLHYLESVDSTNEWAKRDSDHQHAKIDIYLANTQTKGKGSRGRSWSSPPDTSVSMSLAMHPNVSIDKLSMITLVMGMAAAEGICRATGLKTEIKWPNDVVCGGKKVCGILTEYTPQNHCVVIGIGINVNTQSFPEELLDKATSLFLETGAICDRECVTAEVINCFVQYYELFDADGDLHRLRSQYNQMMVNLDRKVRVLDEKAPYEGIAIGIDDNGRLLVKNCETDEVHALFAGEISVRGVYGYV